MKYYTFAWWAGEVEDETVVSRYWAYLDGVKAQLPEAVRAFAYEHNLHDALLLKMHVNPTARTVQCEYDGWDRTSYYPRRYTLVYTDVEALETGGNPARPLGGPGGFGHMGYAEFECLADGLIEHRLLFSTGIELTLRFRGLTFEYEEVGEDG